MVIDWTQTGAGPQPNHPLIRAAEYVRMSTEHQEHSTGNQAAAIRLCAERRGYEIVRTYADEGKSGLIPTIVKPDSRERFPRAG